MRMKKVCTLLLTGVLGTMLVCGCGANETEESTDNSTDVEKTNCMEEPSDTEGMNITEVPTDAEIDGANEFGDPNGGAEVVMWHYFGDEQGQALHQMVKKYNESQSDIYVVPMFVSMDEIKKQYTMGAVSGELPDIGLIDGPDMAAYYSLGVFENISEYVADWEDINAFYTGPMASCKDAEGNIFGIPNNANCLAIACNMDILKQAGIENPPATWDELLKVCEKTSDSEKGVYGLAMSATGTEEGTFQYIPWMYGAGANVADIDSEASVQALSFLSNLVKEGYMSKEVVNWTQNDAYNAFLTGKAAMVEIGTWYIANMDGMDKDKVTFEYQFVAMPRNGENQATVLGGENFGVCKGSEYTRECVDFLKYAMSAENNAEWCSLAGKLPVRGDAADKTDFWTADERYKVFLDSMDFAVARGPHESWPTISEAIYKAEQKAFLGEAAAEDALKEAASIIDPILQETPLTKQ